MILIKSFTTDNNGITTVEIEESDRFTILAVELKTQGFLENLYNIQKTQGFKYSIGCIYNNHKWIIKVIDNDEGKAYEYIHRMVYSTSILKC